MLPPDYSGPLKIVLHVRECGLISKSAKAQEMLPAPLPAEDFAYTLVTDLQSGAVILY